jgi:predicted metal-dependent peptidase
VAWTNGNTHYTYTRRSRRQSALPSVVLPGTRRPVPNVAFVVDTSASVDDLLLGRALGEVDGALRGLGVSGSSVTVLACDAVVQTVERVRSARDARLAGGGGTDMRVGLRAAGELRPRTDVIVVFTDGYTPWPDAAPPGASVIAALLGREGYTMPPTPAWTRRIECRL